MWTVAAVHFAQAHCRSLQSQFIRKSRRNGGDLTPYCTLTAESRTELQWWSTELELVNKRFTQQELDLIMFSDAACRNGAACNGVPARGPWTRSDSFRHINELELWAAYHAIKSFASQSRGISIRIFIDNNTAVSCINRCGGTRSRPFSRVAEEISFWCESRDISLEAFLYQAALTPLQMRSHELGLIRAIGSSAWLPLPGLSVFGRSIWTYSRRPGTVSFPDFAPGSLSPIHLL